MEQTVTIKGTKSGIILVLDPSISFEELSSSIADKFKEASSFLGKHNMGLLIRGRELSEEQTDHVVKLIEANSNLTISCVIHDSEALDKSFQRAMGLLPDIEPEPLYDEDDTPGDDANTFIYRGNVRPGHKITNDNNIVIIGDVKPGGTVISNGSIFVLGELRGNACAGADGDAKAIIMALDFRPIQVSISDETALSPDAAKGVKIKEKKNKLFSGTDNEPQVAYLDNGHIVKTSFGASFLRKHYGL